MNSIMQTNINNLRLELPLIVNQIVERQYKLQPELEKYGIKGMKHSLDDVKSNLEYLISAIEAESKLLFQEYNLWTNRLFFNLKLPKDTMAKFYYCAREVFKERLDKIIYTSRLIVL